MINMDIEYFTSNPKGHLLESHIRKTFPDFYAILMRYPDDLKFAERVYWYFNGLTERPICKHCGKHHTKFVSFNAGYLQFCSQKCSSESSLRVDKIKQTTLNRYGVENASQSNIIKERKRLTLQEHYGVDIPMQSQCIRDKQKATMLDRYGVENASQSDIIKEIKRNTLQEHYGVDSPMQSQRIRDKQKVTMLDRYGVENAFQIHPDRINVKNYKKFKENNELILDIRNNDDGIYYICKCPHPECIKCNDRQFIIGNKQYNSRKYNNVELCTNLMPIQYDHISNTSIEQFVKNILDDHNIEYETNNRKILSGKELDIYIPSYNIAIECNGVYWHSLKSNTYHHDKWKGCNDIGIQLLTLWEDQIIHKPDVVKNIILSKLGIYNKRIGASKCKVCEVSSKDSREFLNTNHLQGYVNGSGRIGLYYKDELVCIMVFGKKRVALGSKDSGNIYELYRFCNKCGVQVIHGAERLFKHFLKEHPGCIVESFSSNDISSGNLYRSLGFELNGEQISSYWYIDRSMQRHHRYSFRKDILVKNGADPNMTEFEITDSMGLYRIYDSGQRKWIHK